MQRIRRCGGATMIALSLAATTLFAVAVAPAAGALSMNACQLITAKDVQSVLGDGYTAKNMMENEIMSQCAYTKGKEAVKEAAVSISLQQTIYDSVQYLKTAQEGIKQNGGPAVTPVGGLGEGAFYVVDPKQKPAIFLLQFGKGKLEVVLSVLRGGKPDIEAAQKLAKIAYSRLK